MEKYVKFINLDLIKILHYLVFLKEVFIFSATTGNITDNITEQRILIFIQRLCPDMSNIYILRFGQPILLNTKVWIWNYSIIIK